MSHSHMPLTVHPSPCLRSFVVAEHAGITSVGHAVAIVIERVVEAGTGIAPIRNAVGIGVRRRRPSTNQEKRPSPA
jgi:hypothetical protein